MTGRTDELDNLIVVGCRILDRLGIFDSSGHLTYRLPGTNSFAISARKAPGLASADDLMVIDEDGNLLDGQGTVPLEWAIHARVYRARPDVHSIVHSHSPMSRAFSISTQPILPVFGIATPWLHSAVPVLDETGPISSSEAGDRLVDVIGDGPAALLHAHGSVVVGPSVEATVVRVVTLEQTAESLLRAMSLGPVRSLDAEQLDAWRTNTPAGHAKAWDYFIAKMEREEAQ